MKLRTIVATVLLAAAVSGCEELGIPDPAKEAARAEAEGEAIGSACRHAGRALEDCYARNPKAEKSAIFAGWLSMNDYMTENNLEVIKPPSDVPEVLHDAAPGENNADRASEELPPEPAPDEDRRRRS